MELKFFVFIVHTVTLSFNDFHYIFKILLIISAYGFRAAFFNIAAGYAGGKYR